LRYQAPVNANPVLNSAFQVWQRGTSGSNNSTGTSGYNADRWQNYLNGTITVSRQATNDTTNLPFIQYCARVQRNSGTTSTGPMYHNQNFETVNSVAYAGKTVTLSFYARAGANYSATSNALSAVLQTGTGTDQNIFGGYTGSATPISATATLTTTWQRFTYTGAVASNVSEMCITFQNTPTGTAGAADFYEVTGVQLEVGSVATPFKTYAGTIQGELAACQRYYIRVGGQNLYQFLGFCSFYTTTLGNGSMTFPVTMRAAPTSIDFSTLRTNIPGAYVAITALTLNSANGTNNAAFDVTSSSQTVGLFGYIQANNSGSAHLGFSAEL
jgi:hypothetical protein